jgi:hypothetical protein
LGLVELHVSALARESSDAQYRYESTGTREATEQFRLEKGNVYKGQLHYTATFIPALALKGIKFESRQPEAATGHGSGDDVSDQGSSISSSDEEVQAVPPGLTYKPAPPKNAGEDAPKTIEATKSNGSAGSSDGSDTAHTAETSAQQEEGVEMSTDDLLAHRTSSLRFMGTTILNREYGQNLVSSSST